MIFYNSLDGKTSQECYRTQTNYYRTEQFFIMKIRDMAQPGATIKHILHVLNLKVHDTVEPYQMPTVFINIDLESVANTDCINNAYALNLLPYRIPVSIETGRLYDHRSLQTGFQCLDVSTGIWRPVLAEVNGKQVIAPYVKGCTTIYKDSDLKVLKYLLPYIVKVRERLPFDKVNIVLTGYNLSRFDNFMIITHWLEHEGFTKEKLHVGIYGNSILTYQLNLSDPFTVITTWDLNRHLAGRLRTNCSSWCIPTGGEKGDIDHRLIQTVYNIEPAGFGKFLDANWDDRTFTTPTGTVELKGIKSYCVQDVIACSTLHFMYKTAVEFISNSYFIGKHGSSLGMIAALNNCEAEEDIAKKRTAWLKANAQVLSKNTLQLVMLARTLDQAKIMTAERFDMKVISTGREVLTLQRKVETDLEYTTLAEDIWKSMGGGLRCSKMRPNIEEYPTLSGFASAIFKILCVASGITQVQGFDYHTTKTLREHMCIAGRSQGRIGYHEEEPMISVDIVSLYPTAMTSDKVKFAVAAMLYNAQTKRSEQYVRCSYTTIAPVSSSSMPAGIWKVRVRDQPRGVVIPPKSKSGYHWETNISTKILPASEPYYAGLYKLVTTPDVDSLRECGADFDVIEGIVFDDTTPDLYKEFIGISATEKTRQDRLKKDPKAAFFEGEKYNAGIREACKAVMCILSGKEITKPYLCKRELYDSEALVYAQDVSNSQKQYQLSQQARECLTSVPHDLVKWRECMKKIEQLPRLTDPPESLGKSTYVAEWKNIPTAGKYSHINGYHIYGAARYIMNQIYSSVGFDAFKLTETDSMVIPISKAPCLYSRLSVFGDPLLCANQERLLGILPGAPECKKPKQFGQLEMDLTEYILPVIAKALALLDPDIARAVAMLEPERTKAIAALSPESKNRMRLIKPEDSSSKRSPLKHPKFTGDGSRITMIRYEGSEVIASAGEPLMYDNVKTGLRGPFVAVGGKKIYAMYFRDRNNKPVFIRRKYKFKGVSFGVDYVIDYVQHAGLVMPSLHPPIFQELSLMTRSQRLAYSLANLENIQGVHRMRKRDIFSYIDNKFLYLIQSRVAENSTLTLKSMQNIIVKKLQLRSEQPTARELHDIFITSEEIRKISLRRMSRCISHYDQDKDTLCEQCDDKADIIIDAHGFCATHGITPESIHLCQHVNLQGVRDCGALVTDKTLCAMHLETEKATVPVYCEAVGCDALAAPAEVIRGHMRCNAHSELKTVQGVSCLFRKSRGVPACTEPVSSKSVKSGYQLCYGHYSQYNKVAKSARIQEYAITAEQQVLLLQTVKKTLARTNLTLACQFLTHKGFCMKTVTAGSQYCRRHQSLISPPIVASLKTQ
jgi:hypothetical protein